MSAFKFITAFLQRNDFLTPSLENLCARLSTDASFRAGYQYAIQNDFENLTPRGVPIPLSDLQTYARLLGLNPFLRQWPSNWPYDTHRLSSTAAHQVYRFPLVEPFGPAIMKVSGQRRPMSQARSLLELSTLIYLRRPALGHCFLDMPWLVTSEIPGQSLQEIIDAPSLELSQKYHLFDQLLTSIAELHNVGIYHGDIKPKNVIVGENLSSVHLIDFDSAVTPFFPHDFLRRFGDAVGYTVEYAAPEVLKGAVDPNSMASQDVFSAGMTLWHLLTGGRYTRVVRSAFMDGVSSQYLDTKDAKHLLAQANGSVPAEVLTFLTQALQENATGRFETIDAMQRAFRTLVMKCDRS